MSESKSLQDVLDEIGGPDQMVERMRNLRPDAYTVPIVPSEVSNWRAEQRAWRETAVLFDQSHHMDTVVIKGPDALDLISDTAINTPRNFAVNIAKQYVPVSHAGFVIGDGVLFRDSAEEFTYVGRPPAGNWLRYHGETGDYSVDIELDPRSRTNPLSRPVVRKYWRFQVQGPNAWSILEKLNGQKLEDLKFFHMGHINVAGVNARSLRHGMSGEPGLEIWGPYESYVSAYEAIMEAGQEFGLVASGGRAYPTNTLESAWIPDPLPAIYTGEELKPYRQWLRAEDCEARNSIAGSFVGRRMEDYYLTPWELGYGGFIKFDHDFIGRDALEAMDAAHQRHKVTLMWNPEDLQKIVSSAVGPKGTPVYKYFDLPLANYGYFNFDTVSDRDDNHVGFSMWTGFSENERSGLSLATVTPETQVGDEVYVLWGEPDGGTSKATVEPHQQIKVRAVVAEAPISPDARERYAEGWRTQAPAGV
jgi:vanillate/3-O-methylgallate O-demethylase